MTASERKDGEIEQLSLLKGLKPQNQSEKLWLHSMVRGKEISRRMQEVILG